MSAEHPNPFHERWLRSYELCELWENATLEERLAIILSDCQGPAEWCHPQVLDVLAVYMSHASVWLRVITAAKRSGITPRHLQVAVEQVKRAKARERYAEVQGRIN